MEYVYTVIHTVICIVIVVLLYISTMDALVVMKEKIDKYMYRLVYWIHERMND